MNIPIAFYSNTDIKLLVAYYVTLTSIPSDDTSFIHKHSCFKYLSHNRQGLLYKIRL